MIYRLLYHGGPRDGDDILSVRPYYATRDEDGRVYASRFPPDQLRRGGHLAWEDDETRRIDLDYLGVLTPEEYDALGKRMLP